MKKIMDKSLKEDKVYRENKPTLFVKSNEIYI